MDGPYQSGVLCGEFTSGERHHFSAGPNLPRMTQVDGSSYQLIAWQQPYRINP